MYCSDSGGPLSCLQERQTRGCTTYMACRDLMSAGIWLQASGTPSPQQPHTYQAGHASPEPNAGHLEAAWRIATNSLPWQHSALPTTEGLHQPCAISSWPWQMRSTMAKNPPVTIKLPCAAGHTAGPTSIHGHQRDPHRHHR